MARKRTTARKRKARRNQDRTQAQQIRDKFDELQNTAGIARIHLESTFALESATQDEAESQRNIQFALFQLSVMHELARRCGLACTPPVDIGQDILVRIPMADEKLLVRVMPEVLDEYREYLEAKHGKKLGYTPTPFDNEQLEFDIAAG